LYLPIKFDTINLADRFLFFDNGSIKEYDFIVNNQSATYKIKLDKATKVRSVEGTPLVYRDLKLNANKDSFFSRE